MSRLSEFLNPVEVSTIKDNKGSVVTVVSTHGGRTSLNTEELYKSNAVQDFIDQARSTPIESALKK